MQKYLITNRNYFHWFVMEKYPSEIRFIIGQHLQLKVAKISNIFADLWLSLAGTYVPTRISVKSVYM